MRTAQTVAPGQLKVVEEDPPQPDELHVLIQTERVGLCGSDVALFNGTHPYATFPTVQGHEFAGLVIDTGGRSDLAIGDRVTVEPFIPCGRCYACLRGRGNCCPDLLVMGAHVPGALQETVAVRPDAVFSTHSLPPELAALVEPVSVAVHAVERGQIEADETTLVLGAGPIGLGVLVAARDRGARVMIADRSPSRLQIAESIGAELVIRTSEHDLLEAVAGWTDNDGVAVVVDATGAPEMVQTGFTAAAHSGRVVLVGISTRDLSIPLNDYIRKELTVLGSRNSAGEFASAIELVTRHQESFALWVTHRFSLADTASAMRMAAEESHEAGKIMIEVS